MSKNKSKSKSTKAKQSKKHDDHEQAADERPADEQPAAEGAAASEAKPKSKRRQQEIPGFERQVEDPDIEAAARDYCALRDERSALSKRESKAQALLLATMHAKRTPRYVYLDDAGEELEVVVQLGTEKAVVRRTGEAETPIGQGVEQPDAPDTAAADFGPGGNVLAQAAAAQTAAGVSETDDGDVVPPDVAQPRSKRGRKAAR